MFNLEQRGHKLVRLALKKNSEKVGLRNTTVLCELDVNSERGKMLTYYFLK